MKRQTIRGDRGITPFWHRSSAMTTIERLYCPCGAIVYEGPKPKFSAVSCPKCKRATPVKPQNPPGPLGPARKEGASEAQKKE